MLVVLLLMACQGDTHPVFSPSPSASPHSQPTAAVLQSGDVPAGLIVCVGSGPMDVYLSVLHGADPTLATRLTGEWTRLQLQGATAGAISTFTASSPACNTELGAMTNVKASRASSQGSETKDRRTARGSPAFLDSPRRRRVLWCPV